MGERRVRPAVPRRRHPAPAGIRSADGGTFRQASGTRRAGDQDPGGPQGRGGERLRGRRDRPLHPVRGRRTPAQAG